MKRTHKRITILALSLIFLIVAVLAGIHYLPLNKILKVSSTPETEFVNNPQGSASAPNSILFDFEVDPGSGNKDGLYQGIAHSGQFSAKAFGKNSYSIAIDRTAEQVGVDNLQAVGVSAWVYVFPTDNDIQGSYVFSVNNDLGVNICWKNVGLAGANIPKGKWFKISGLFNLSDIKWKPNYRIQVYFWNNSSTDILVDDYYIVFGGPVERRGDSALADMTRGQPFVSMFNYAPFPVIYLEKQDIGNHDSPYIIDDGSIKAGNISPLSKTYAGRFTQNPDGCDDLLAISPDKKIGMYHFCSDQKRFLAISTSSPPDILAFFSGGEVLKGNFTSTAGEQFVSFINGRISLGEFEKVKGTCSGNGLVTSFKVLSIKGEINAFSSSISTGTRILAGDLDNDRLTEILFIGEKGNWDLIKYEVNSPGWKLIASNPGNPVMEWMENDYAFNVSAGKFIDRFPQDLVLTIFTSKITRQKGYSIRIYDAAKKQFIPLLPGKQHFIGKTIGLDTLSLSDQFFPGCFDNSGKTRIFRYNRDWRYDLKEIRFNDTTFQILANIDFSGYEQDHNPKYYGLLKIIPGKFLNSRETSFLLTGRNCKMKDDHGQDCDEFEDLPFLPDFISLYACPK